MEPKDEPAFCLGDVVWLKSGGHAMVVIGAAAGCNGGMVRVAALANTVNPQFLDIHDEPSFMAAVDLPAACLTKENPSPMPF